MQTWSRWPTEIQTSLEIADQLGSTCYNQGKQKSIPEHITGHKQADGIHQQKTTSGASPISWKQGSETIIPKDSPKLYKWTKRFQVDEPNFPISSTVSIQ